MKGDSSMTGVAEGPSKARGATRKPRHVDLRVGVRMRQRRVAVGLTLHELASRVGVSFQQLQKYETGDTRIPASRLHEIAQVLAVPITWFFLPEVPATETSAAPPQKASLIEETDQLVRLFSAIDEPRMRKVIMELVTLLAAMSGK
jgi:transcriptional regulator with XRE-family HTH domain